MKLIIASSKGITDRVLLVKALQMTEPKLRGVTEILVTGEAETISDQASQLAKIGQLKCTVVRMDDGRDSGASRRRDRDLVKQAGKDATLLAIMFRGGSRGMYHLINAAKARGVQVFVHFVERPTDKDKPRKSRRGLGEHRVALELNEILGK